LPESNHDPRPDFMVTLGLAPPYVLEDVKQAYRDKVKLAHPDHGGTLAAFNEIQTAFERAQEFLQFRGDRRGWIAAKMARYTELQDAVSRLRRFGAEVTTHAPDWLERSYGDFAQLTETATVIRLEKSPDGAAFIQALVADHHLLRELETLELPGCKLTDAAVLSLTPFQQLKRLDLSYTPVTNESLPIVDSIESLQEINLDGTNVGWWTKRRVNATLSGREELRLA
jgi:hypothetical protein